MPSHITIKTLAAELGLSVAWIETNWLRRPTNPLPTVERDGRQFVAVDALKSWCKARVASL
ncbi:hypothetical protein NG895_12355 [Aeoliella sp. ICT_H6.2]|uniref:Uncharacterized protein n=1 Tax=Aeoliella straminimaris TaxID=2954799 RepID=A0A9X2FHC0_9BACT|nr:hypothetical protein [Aeoliella straminimaris]MCO6044701.1 hypothetical protein [Aeoliella straminimaris]